MKITFNYRNPTPVHCKIGIFINGGLAGELTLRQEELGSFQQIVSNGCVKDIDKFLATGDPNWEGHEYYPITEK